MKKVIVIGCPGSGKSTFSRSLHAVTGIPLYHLDNMYWNTDKTKVEKTVFYGRLHDTLQKDEWILDGNFLSTMEIRMQACDTVFFLDYPLEVCLSGIYERQGKPRSDMPWVGNAGDDPDFLAFIKSFNAQSRPTVVELLRRYPDKELHVFKSRDDAKVFLKSFRS